MYEYHLNEKVKQWMPNESYEDVAEAEDAIDFFSGCVEKEELPYVLAVTSKLTGELVGDTGINEVEGKPGEVETWKIRFLRGIDKKATASNRNILWFYHTKNI